VVIEHKNLVDFPTLQNTYHPIKYQKEWQVNFSYKKDTPMRRAEYDTVNLRSSCKLFYLTWIYALLKGATGQIGKKQSELNLMQ